MIAMKSRLIFIAAVICFIGIAGLPWRWNSPVSIAFAADTINPAAKLITGLTVSFQNATGETIDAREARLVALLVPAGSPASPFIAPGPFGASWSGLITARFKDTYSFSAAGSGDLTVILNDQKLLDLHGDFANQLSQPVLVKRGQNKLQVIYHSPPQGDAALRLLWAPTGKSMEPVPPTAFIHDAADDLLLRHALIRNGRELVAEQRCAACHQGLNGDMPELKQDAPNLTDLKHRLRPQWLAYWISNPKALRPTASMPRVFHDSTATPQPAIDPRAGDIAAYLSENVAPTDPNPAAGPAMLARGARLFTGLGCVSCHIAPGVQDSDVSLNRVPLQFVKAKFQPQALRDFLLKPESHYAWIKMPNFHLSDDETSAVAAWLLSRCTDDALPSITTKFDPVNGKKLFETTGCLSCHAADKTQSSPPSAIDFAHADFTRGCLSGDVGKGVDFAFADEQRKAIAAFIAVDWRAALQRDPVAEFSARQMISLRCNACHSTDGHDNLWANLDTEISSIEQDLPPRPDNDPEPKGDQSRPPLTWTGEKLQPSWTAAFIAGDIPYKPRQWVFARMPSFVSRAALLSKGLAMSHACPATDEARPPVDQNLADIGRPLTSQSSFGCVKCHAVGDQPALAPFEAEAPNLSHIQARLRHDYYTHWMRNPQYYLPGTKMPGFANSEGLTPYKDILNGNAAAEYEAVWNYLRAGEKIVPVQ